MKLGSGANRHPNRFPIALHILAGKPRGWANDLLNPSLPQRPGDDCIFINQAADGTMSGLVKRLLRASADHWRIRQLNPQRDFDLSKKKWSRAYRIAETRHRG